MARSPQTGIRNVVLRVLDASSPQKSRTLLCHSASVPVPTDPEPVKVKPEHALVAVIAGADVESTLSFSIGVEAFLDATQPTMEEIVNGNGAGANWTPINDSIANVQVAAQFRCFTFEFHMDNRAQGGVYTIRSVQAHVKPDPAFERADPNVISFSGEVYGTITDRLGP